MSLDDLSDADIEKLWLEEIERRLREIDDGKVRGMPADKAYDKALARLNR
jgi:hypothetical protein